MGDSSEAWLLVRVQELEAALEHERNEKETVLAANTATINYLRKERDEARAAHAGSEGVLSMTVHRLEGTVEGRPTARHNFLQRIDELREIEGANILNANALRALQQRIAEMDPWAETEGDDERCVFCDIARHRFVRGRLLENKHGPNCVWQQQQAASATETRG